MRERPSHLEDRLHDALVTWGIHVVAFDHVPLGFGDHHWSAIDTLGRRWFTTVADLGHKPHLGLDPGSARRRLEQAMDTAARLHDVEGLGFVVAPLRTPTGATLVSIDDRHVLSVFPFVEGVSGVELTADRRLRVLDLLARLHRRGAVGAPAVPVHLRGGDRLSRLLDHPTEIGDTGPHAGPTAELLAEHAAPLRERLAEFDRDTEALREAPTVTTHGEPHPGNLLWLGDRPLLVDWDTVGMAAPERDLWSVTGDPAELDHYARVRGHRPDPALMDLYRLRAELQDLVEFVGRFGAHHGGGADDEQAWRGLVAVVERLATRSGVP